MMQANTNKMVCLNDTNYHLWKGKMKDMLFVKKLYLPVFATEKPKDKTDEDESLSINKFVVLFVNMLKIVFIITLLMRKMQNHCGRILRLCMLLIQETINYIC